MVGSAIWRNLESKGYTNLIGRTSSELDLRNQAAVEAFFEEAELLDLLNFTPTESEAWDIVQMEEIERELMDGDDIEFEKPE